MTPLPRPLAFLGQRLVLGLLLLTGARAATPAIPRLSSPNGALTVDVHPGSPLSYTVRLDDQVILQDAKLALQVDNLRLGENAPVKAVTPRTQDAMLEPVVRQKFARVREHYNELRVEFEGGYAVTFRAYDEGMAYRWETAFPAERVTVRSEQAVFAFAGNHPAWYPEEQSFYSHNERLFQPRPLGDIGTKNLASLPVVVETGNLRVALAEADLADYPGLWFTGTGGNALAATFPPAALEEKQKGDRDVEVVKAADYLAVTRGTRTYPWRIVAVARHDADLLTNQLPWLLAAPSRVADTSWIKPGKVAWDWWNANNITGVDFKSGVNNATYRAYIDFAARNGLAYIILDEGWYKLGDLLAQVPDIDVPGLVAYGHEKGVRVILWVAWKTLDDQLLPALDRFAQWGVAGIKVDFMQRSDQAMINFYERVNREAAARHLLTDFHGAIQPALMTRTWPNLMSTEGVRGLEWNKWSTHITPEHDASLPFTRQFLGPMDYTPGAMHNANRDGFAANFNRPSSQGTRCHQLGLYVVFESPLMMLADTPSNYDHEPECLEFLRAVPSTWDDTHVLDARLGDYVVTARRHGDTWFAGAITDWAARDLDVDLSFLPPGKYELTEWRDGVNADRNAEDYRRTTRTVSAGERFSLHLAPGGGWAAILRPAAH